MIAKEYLIAKAIVTDPEAYAGYARAAGKLLKAFRAEAIVQPDMAIIKKGNPRARNVIFEFDGFDRAKGVLGQRGISEGGCPVHRSGRGCPILIEGVY